MKVLICNVCDANYDFFSLLLLDHWYEIYWGDSEKDLSLIF